MRLGLDLGDRQALEQKYAGCDPPCLLDSSDGRFVLKGVNYNPLDVMNCLTQGRGYRVEGEPQQRTLPNIHSKDGKSVFIAHITNRTQFSSLVTSSRMPRTSTRPPLGSPRSSPSPLLGETATSATIIKSNTTVSFVRVE